jgi:DNA mismatch repair protein MutH
MKFDETNPVEIEKYGKRLINGSLSSVEGIKKIPENELMKSISGRTRGSFGNIIETHYYGINPGNESRPDFYEAGVELKTTPIYRLKNGMYSAKERLVLGMIDYLEESKKTFEQSSYFLKNNKLMIISYLYEENKTIGNTEVILAKLYELAKLPEEDQRIILEDWNKINYKIRNGLAHELSEGDTFYLGACTKSATGKNRREQVSGILAKPRAFSYKQSYMTTLVRRELKQESLDSEKVIKTGEIDNTKTFEKQILDRFKPFLNKTTRVIEEKLKGEFNLNSKQYYASLARGMLGVKKKNIEEFEAADVVMKTIQLKADGKPKESMSFPTFKYTEIVNEVWDGDEEMGEVRPMIQKLLERRFLFIVYRCENVCKKREDRIFEKAFFWTMKQSDLEEVHNVWKETVKRVNEGNAENLPKMSESRVSHIRPHGKNREDTYDTPQGKQVTKKCFWLNSDFIDEVVKSN